MAMKRIAAMLLASVLLLYCVGCAQDGRKEPGAETMKHVVCRLFTKI